MGNQVLVFGAQGFIGRVITKQLSESRDLEPVQIFRKGPKHLVQLGGKVKEYESLEALGESLLSIPKPIAAVNAAALTNKEDSHLAIQSLIESNVTLSALIAKICVDIGVERLVHFGTFSTSVDGINSSPQTFYAASKSAGYEVLRFFSRSENLKVVIIEPFDIYAADHPHGKIISTLVEVLSNGRELELSKGEQELAPIHALDVATSAIEATTMPISEQYSIWSLPGPEVLTLRQLATEIAIALGAESNLNLLSFVNPYRSNEIFRVAPRFSTFPRKAVLRVREGVNIAALAGHETIQE